MDFFSNDLKKIENELKTKMYKELVTSYIYKQLLDHLAKDKSLSGEEYRLALLLITKLTYFRFTQISKAKISRELEMKEQNVGRAINNLENKNFLIRDNSNKKMYKINPEIISLEDINLETGSKHYKERVLCRWKNKQIKLITEE